VRFGSGCPVSEAFRFEAGFDRSLDSTGSGCSRLGSAGRVVCPACGILRWLAMR